VDNEMNRNRLARFTAIMGEETKEKYESTRGTLPRSFHDMEPAHDETSADEARNARQEYEALADAFFSKARERVSCASRDVVPGGTSYGDLGPGGMHNRDEVWQYSDTIADTSAVPSHSSGAVLELSHSRPFESDKSWALGNKVDLVGRVSLPETMPTTATVAGRQGSGGAARAGEAVILGDLGWAGNREGQDTQLLLGEEEDDIRATEVSRVVADEGEMVQLLVQKLEWQRVAWLQDEVLAEFETELTALLHSTARHRAQARQASHDAAQWRRHLQAVRAQPRESANRRLQIRRDVTRHAELNGGAEPSVNVATQTSVLDALQNDPKHADLHHHIHELQIHLQAEQAKVKKLEDALRAEKEAHQALCLQNQCGT